MTVAGIPEPVTSANAATILLDQLYAGFPEGSQLARRDDISAVARAAVDKLKSEHVDLAQLADTLGHDVAGRHLLLWDEVPSYEATITKFGVSGAIDTVMPDRSFHLSVQSATAAKLDYFVRLHAAMQVSVDARGDARVNTTVAIFNGAPTDAERSYQFGPDGINSHTPGQYVSSVFLWSPRGSQSNGISESGLEVNQVETSVLPQQSRTVFFTTLIPHAIRNGRLTLHLIPQSTLYPASWTVSVSAPGRDRLAE